MTKQSKLLSLAASLSAALVATSVSAAEAPKVDLPRDLDGYVAQDKAFWDYLKANHSRPIIRISSTSRKTASWVSSRCRTVRKNG